MVSLKLKAVFRLLQINKAYWFFLLVLFAACRSGHNDERLPFYNTADFTARWIRGDDEQFKYIHTIDTFAMPDQSGNMFTADSLKGKIYTANFFFTICPSICPKMMYNLKNLQDIFLTNDNIRMVSFSVMPWVDSVKKLAAYGESMSIDPQKWHLLTGNKERINTLGRQSFFAEKKEGLQKDVSEFLHTEQLLLIDKQARIRGVYNATLAADITRAAADIKILLKE
jgi:protein SCO1/2